MVTSFPHHELQTDDQGRLVITNSMLKTFRQCKKEFFYKHVLRIQPKVYSTPLTRGKWFHDMLEAHYLGGDPWLIHKKWTSQYNKLFDEEKERLGDLPTEIRTLFRSYLWHYGDPEYKDELDWKVLEAEKTLETPLTDEFLFRGRVDLIVETAFGISIVDHKTHKRIPDWNLRLLDEQSTFYVWAANQLGIPVSSFIWNYIVTKPASVPTPIKDGTRFSKSLGETDFPTMNKAIKEAMKEHPGVFPSNTERERLKIELRRLKNVRWAPGMPQTSPFFRRDEIIKDDDLTQRVLKTAIRTANEIANYDWSDEESVERNVDSCNGFKCSYRSLVEADLLIGDSDMAKRREYKSADPFGYYDGTDEPMGAGKK